MNRRWLVLALACAVAGLAPASSHAVNHIVTVTNQSTFDPAAITIQLGDTVTFQKGSTGVSHNVRSDAFTNGCTPSPTCFRSGAPTTGSFTLGPLAFDQVGLFRYFCEVHGGTNGLGMAGTITVQGDTPTPTPTPTPPPPPPTQQAGIVRFTNANYNRGEAIGMASISVERISGDDGAVGVAYDSIGGGTATAGPDFAPATGLLSWADGEDGIKNFNVAITNDATDEPNETVNLQILNPTGGVAIGSPSNATLTIVDDDGAGSPGAVQFTSNSFTVGETQPQATVSVARIGGVQGAASVEYDTSDGTAHAGQDYTAVGGTLNWSNGDAADKSFNVPILDDIDFEGNESVGVALSSPVGAALGTVATATVTINDNEAVPPCTDGDFQVCLLERFLLRIHWMRNNGQSGEGRVTKLTDSAASFEFFEPGNVEVVAKMKDACALPAGNLLRNFWPFIAGLTNVRVEVTIIDTRSGFVRRFYNGLNSPFFTAAPDSPDGKTNPPGAIQATTEALGAFPTCDA